MLKREDIRIRDPFILTDKENGCYYMYGTTALLEGSNHAGNTFSVYKTRDLENFEEPVVVVDGEALGFWADRDYWAPEVHKYNGKYYLCGSGIADGKNRATSIFVSDTPDGRFVPVSDKGATPEEWMCLDGTLWVENGKPYLVFCHEWLEIGDGAIVACELSEDLSHRVGEPITLFTATSFPGVEEIGNSKVRGYVTDGPFLYNEGERLCMIWSTYLEGHRYVVLVAQSESGSVLGPWRQLGSRFDFDGGHAMIFNTLEGERMMSLHAPNRGFVERAVFIKI